MWNSCILIQNNYHSISYTEKKSRELEKMINYYEEKIKHLQEIVECNMRKMKRIKINKSNSDSKDSDNNSFIYKKIVKIDRWPADAWYDWTEKYSSHRPQHWNHSLLLLTLYAWFMWFAVCVCMVWSDGLIWSYLFETIINNFEWKCITIRLINK